MESFLPAQSLPHELCKKIINAGLKVDVRVVADGLTGRRWAYALGTCANRSLAIVTVKWSCSSTRLMAEMDRPIFIRLKIPVTNPRRAAEAIC